MEKPGLTKLINLIFVPGSFLDEYQILSNQESISKEHQEFLFERAKIAELIKQSIYSALHYFM